VAAIGTEIDRLVVRATAAVRAITREYVETKYRTTAVRATPFKRAVDANVETEITITIAVITISEPIVAAFAEAGALPLGTMITTTAVGVHIVRPPIDRLSASDAITLESAKMKP